MKANNYMKQLKEMVNNNVLETVETVKYGVQAYNISANEYEVITKFVKQGGRYYFVPFPRLSSVQHKNQVLQSLFLSGIV